MTTYVAAYDYERSNIDNKRSQTVRLPTSVAPLENGEHPVLLRRPHELADLIRDARARAGLSQGDLANKVGVSRQWVSLAENGRTGVAFDLVVGTLQALGYRLYIESTDEVSEHDLQVREPLGSHSPGQLQRRTLTRGGKPLGHQRSGSLARTQNAGDERP
jgi:transcriptional regulator with XRE-family HTH domain